MPLNARGARGELRVGHKVVAKLAAWTLQESRFEAKADGEVNTFWLSGDYPVSLAIPMGRREWVWPNVQIHDATDPVVVVVSGVPEVR